MFEFEKIPGMGDKRARIAAGVACVAVVAAIGAGVVIAGNGNNAGSASSATADSASSAAADSADAQVLNAPQTVTVSVTADQGWTASATPAIVHITGRTATGDADTDEDIDFYHAVNPSKDNAGSDDIELSPGVYTAETISPLNADGSAYTVWKTGEAKHFAVGFDDDGEDEGEGEAQATSAVIANPFVTVAYAAENEDDVHYHAYADCNDCHGHFDLYSDEWREHVRDTGHMGYVRHRYTCTETDCTYTKLEKQGNRFVVQMEKVPADQVTDEMVKDIVDKTTEAVKGGDSSLKGDAGKDVLEKLDTNVKNNANASEETKDSAETAKETTDTSSEGKQTTTSATTSGNASSSNASSGNASSGNAVHTHSWVASTHTVHHDAVTHTVHHDAVTHTENITETAKYYVCNDCGFRVTSDEFHDDRYDNGVGNDWVEHMRNTGHLGYHTERENVVVGTNTVVDQAAWDETVVDSAAWDETVTDGYRCSTCGATK